MSAMLVDRADHPTEVLARFYEQQLEQLQSVKKDISDVIAAQKRLQMDESTLALEVAKLDEQARDATSSEEADLARAAVERKDLLQADARSLDLQISELEGAKEQLSNVEAKLRAWAEPFPADNDVAWPQYSAADAQAYLSGVGADVGDALADVAFGMQRAVENT